MQFLRETPSDAFDDGNERPIIPSGNDVFALAEEGSNNAACTGLWAHQDAAAPAEARELAGQAQQARRHAGRRCATHHHSTATQFARQCHGEILHISFAGAVQTPARPRHIYRIRRNIQDVSRFRFFDRIHSSGSKLSLSHFCTEKLTQSRQCQYIQLNQCLRFRSLQDDGFLEEIHAGIVHQNFHDKPLLLCPIEKRLRRVLARQI